ncbi:MAG: hypothetical protein ACTTKH_05390, partial [Treponema sp.]
HYADFSKKLVSETGSELLSIKDLYQRIKKLFLKTYDGNKIRLLGMGVSNMMYESIQNDLFMLDKDAKLRRMEHAIVKFNDGSIISARLLKTDDH